MATGSVGEAGSEGVAAAGKLKSLQRTSRYCLLFGCLVILYLNTLTSGFLSRFVKILETMFNL